MNLRLNVDTSGAIFSGQAPAIVQSNLDRAITEATLLLYAKVTSHTPQGVSAAQGGLLGSIQQESGVKSKGTPLVHGIVMSSNKHAEVTEKGRRPGKGIASAVPGDKYVSPLLPWIRVKLGLSGKAADRAAYLIGRKIKTEGFEGAHMFEKAFTENLSQIQNIFERCGLTITQELANGK